MDGKITHWDDINWAVDKLHQPCVEEELDKRTLEWFFRKASKLKESDHQQIFSVLRENALEYVSLEISRLCKKNSSGAGGMNPSSLALSALSVYWSLQTKKDIGDSAPDEFGLDYEEFGFKSKDGISLSGWFIPAKKNHHLSPTIIICHGYKSKKSYPKNSEPADDINNIKYAKMLSGHGFSSVMFDFRGHGKSDGTYFIGEGYPDILGLEDHLASKGIENLGIVGLCGGAAETLCAAPFSKNIKAVVIDSVATFNDPVFTNPVSHELAFKLPISFAELTREFYLYFAGIWHNGILNCASIVKDVKQPILIIHGTGDNRVLSRSAKEIFKNANEPKQLWLVKGGYHIRNYNKNPEEYEIKVIDFFNKYLDIPNIT